MTRRAATAAPEPPVSVHETGASASAPEAGPPDRLAAARIEPALTINDWGRVLSCSRRGVERMRSAGKLPPPDFRVGRCPRWRAATVRAWLERGGR
jgi:hypothetical protein